MQVRLRPDSERWSTKFVCDVYFRGPVSINRLWVLSAIISHI